MLLFPRKRRIVLLSDQQGKRINHYVPDYIVFDLETTGLSYANDAVIEISAIKVKNGKTVGEYSTLVNPGREIPYGASCINGITDEMVAQSPSFESAFRQFLDFAGNEVLVGHNIQCFDMRFLYRDADKFWGKTVGNDYIDTLRIAKQYLPELSHHTLSALAEHYGISTAGAHRALNDCRMNQKIFELLAEEMRHPERKGLLICPECGQVLKRRKSKYGEFWGCSGYPECRYTKNSEEGK